MVPLFLSDAESRNFRSYLVNYIEQNYDFDSWITTRFDNDDAIRFDYVEQIQKCCDKYKGEYAICFPDGYQYDKRKNALIKYHFPNNHFSTFVSESKDKTVYDYGHINLTSQNIVYYLNKSIPMWVEIIHQDNVYNRMGVLNPFDYVKRRDLKDEFGIDIFISSSSIRLIYLYVYFTVRKAWDKRDRILIYICRKLHIRYKDDRIDR